MKTSLPDLKVHSLASGSSGNAMLVCAAGTNLLIDAGLPLRTLSNALAKRGVGTTDLHAILLTHEHSDHSVTAGAMSRRSGAPVVANAATLQAYAEREALSYRTSVLATGDSLAVGKVVVRSFPVSHDAAEPVGFVLDVQGVRISYFTDTGCKTPALREALRGCHLAIVEANHDLQWLWRGSYTPEMKARVASDTGHLSNDDCADLLAERLELDGPFTIWLAHLSRANNSPVLARRSVAARIAQHTSVPYVMDVALRDHPSLNWRAGAMAVQPTLF
jgi:phosphoribosyl 1,2-cyclic phosphodiesterase